LLTCNFQLTVERVKKALEGLDAYLLVANSRGINVWCAATGGHLTAHDVVSVLKTSGIEDLVVHRNVILPQLAATGIEVEVVREKTGWAAVWGPVDAADIPDFLENGRKATAQMRKVEFPWSARLETAVSWAFPMSLLVLLGLPWWGKKIIPFLGLVWALAFLIFFSFPLYQNVLRGAASQARLRQLGVALSFWCLTMAAPVYFGWSAESFAWGPAVRWGVASLIVCLVLCVDLMGSTPLYKSSTHEDRHLEITLDGDSCTGVGACEEVCPTNVFDVDGSAELARVELCVQCGACIVQCPMDALFFMSPEGTVVTPDTVRRYKLNLLGKRAIRLERE
jgi:NAD-dependent dihydropyrimidine dehydrogenase PreA subunit